MTDFKKETEKPLSLEEAAAVLHELARVLDAQDPPVGYIAQEKADLLLELARQRRRGDSEN